MEEVDRIIIHTLKSIGCEIDEDVQHLLQFSTEQTVEAVAQCIKTINGNADVPHKLPPSMSARFRVGSTLAKAIQDLGYKGDVGYQTFLYSNEADLRRVFLFLLENLPKDSSEAETEVLGASALLQHEISAEIKCCLTKPWLPLFCRQKGIKWQGTENDFHGQDIGSMHSFQSCSLAYPVGVFDPTKNIPKDLKAYYNIMPLVHNQLPNIHQLSAAVLETNLKMVSQQHEWDTEWNQAGLASRLPPQEYKENKQKKINKKIAECLQQSLQDYSEKTQGAQDLGHLLESLESKMTSVSMVKGSRFTYTQKLQFAQDDEKMVNQVSMDAVGQGQEEDQQKKQEQEIEMLKADLTEVTAKVEAFHLDIKKMKASLQQSKEKLTNLKENVKDKKEAYLLKKKAMELLPNAEENLAKLQELVDSSAQRLVKLANQWEKHRAPLIMQYRELKELSDSKQGQLEERVSAVQEIRNKIKESATEARSKDELLRQLHAEYNSMAKDVNRSAYTKRILEIVSNITKQKQQIDQVLMDTRNLQKDINRLSGKLDRTFAVTDELIFKDAKKDESIRKAYKYLASLHQNCNAVIQTVEETGVIMREIRDLEELVEQEQKRNIQENLVKITKDYKTIKAENAALIAKLKNVAAC